MGVWVAGGISGGHLNPAVTISLAVYRGFPWRKVPGYILAQIIGSMTAAGTTYGLYRGAINIFEGGENIRTVSGPNATAALFSTYPREFRLYYLRNGEAEYVNSGSLQWNT
jgi:aquaglyceroporin related protein